MDVVTFCIFLLFCPWLADAFGDENCAYGVCSNSPPRNLSIAPFGSGMCTGDDAIIGTDSSYYILNGYNKLELPGGGHVRVSVENTVAKFLQIWVQEVSKIIEITSEFELDIYVTERWTDPALAYSHLNPCKSFQDPLFQQHVSRRADDPGKNMESSCMFCQQQTSKYPFKPV
ncbi:hypothetical protein NECAME_10070 [Necator americanus]|uniref:Neurotransmitter-gated ion-channel ligand-binding domain-containing protein n=1 Tax=Necator americanus TaxID=51031 RepID=W2TB26_NECAM|nr:hypothetical protein NECAME_10070 [Necator americanus]ETN79068.1 hypothetical protein NECAME_10070 [Necator americanus]